ncbi:MAG: nucleotide-binding protein [Oscillospiraceae bacterium]|nr:nucleotide-binding protein [Oscillospiraceae bacterium]
MNQYKVKYKVLVLDDNRFFLDRLYPKICEINLKTNQYIIECICVLNRRDFINELQSGEYDLVIIDICIRDSDEQEVYDFLRRNMGVEFSGLDLYHEIKKCCPNARVFAMSNLPITHMRVAFNYNTNIDYFFKGGTMPVDEIARCVKTYFDTNMRRIRNNVFIVYGHNELMKKSAENFLGTLGLRAINLVDDSMSGIQSIYDALEDCANLADCAIILISGDDIAYNKNGFESYRARQNVVFEMGFFAGFLGRGKVMVLYEENNDFEFPSDIKGVFYIPYSNNGGWMLILREKLKKIGFELN